MPQLRESKDCLQALPSTAVSTKLNVFFREQTIVFTPEQSEKLLYSFTPTLTLHFNIPMPHLRQLLLILVVLLASCGTVRRSVVPEREEVVLTFSDQQKYEYYFLEAVRLEQQARYDEAFEMLQHSLSICPTAPSALYKMASYYFVLNQKEKAAQALLGAVAGEPDNYWYRQTLASYYQSSREYDKAIATIEEMQRLFPKRNGELLPALVGLYGHTEQYDKVIDVLTRLELLTGKSEAISMEKVRNYLLMGNTEGAFSEVEALAAEYPDNSYYRIILAEVYMDHGREEETLPILQEVLAQEPNNGAAKITLSQYYKQQGDTTNYLATTDSIMMSPDVSDDFKVRVMVQLIKENGDSTLLMDLFERALARPQQSARLGHLCAQYMLSIEQPEARVRPILLRILEVEPDHIPARSQLLAYAAQRNDVEEMVRICSEGIDYNPEVLEYYYYKGVGLCYYLDQPEEALEVFRQATRQIGEGSDIGMANDIYTVMGDLLQELDEVEEACTCYDMALKYQPGDIVVLNNYAYLLSEKGGDLERAEEMSRRTIEAEPNNATYLDTYAWILYRMQRYEEALTYMRQAIEADTEPSDELYEHAGDIHYSLGETAQALDYWRQALDLQRKEGTTDNALEKKIKEVK